MEKQVEKEIAELKANLPNFFQPQSVRDAYNYGPRREALDNKLEAIRQKKRDIGYLTGFTAAQKRSLKQMEQEEGRRPGYYTG